MRIPQGPKTAIYCVITLILFGFGANSAAAQDCPADRVCITREAAIKAVQDAETVKAQEDEIKTLKESIHGKDGYKDIIHKCEVKFAQVSGEYSGFKQGRVSVDAAFEIAVKNTKKKCSPLSICF